jgi:hypothetical protein
MIERDDNIPPLDELIVEVNRTREIAAQVLPEVLPQTARQAG